MRDIVLTALDYLRWYATQLLCRALVWLARGSLAATTRTSAPPQRWRAPD